MRIGVVISTIGKVDKLNLTFASLAAQTHVPHQVIVVEMGGIEPLRDPRQHSVFQYFQSV